MRRFLSLILLFPALVFASGGSLMGPSCSGVTDGYVYTASGGVCGFSAASGGGGSGSQIVAFAYLPSTASVSWTRASTTLGAFGTNASTPAWTVVYCNGSYTCATSASQLPKFSMTSLPAGTYKVTFQSEALNSTADWTSVAVNDGTTTSPPLIGPIGMNGVGSGVMAVGVFTYGSSGTQSWQMYGASGSGTITMFNNSSSVGPSVTTVTVEKI